MTKMPEQTVTNHALVNIDVFSKERLVAFEKFKRAISHVNAFTQKAMIKAYCQASDDQAMILDKAKME
jgi:hypothetical protein